MIGQTRRGFLRMSALGSIAAIAAACQPKVVEKEVLKEVEKVVKETVIVEGTPKVIEKVVVEQAPQEPVLVQWYDYDITTNFPQELVQSFAQVHPEIEVEVVGTAGDYYDKLQTILAAGMAPDLMNFQSWRWQPYCKKGVLKPLDELIERDNWTVPYSDRWAATWDPQIKLDGKIYAQPHNTAAMLMFYVKQPFDELGIPYPTADWTFEDFKELCLKMTYEKDGVKHYGFQADNIYERLASWMRINGEKEWDTEIEPRTAMWTQQTIVDMLQFQLYDCYHTLKVSPTPADMQGGTSQIQTGLTAMKYEGCWFLDQMQGPSAAIQGGVAFDVVPMPKGTAGAKHMGFGHIQAMSSTTREEDATFTLMKYIGGEEGMTLFIENTGRQPNNPEFNERIWVPRAMEKYNFENGQAFIDCMETGVVHVVGLNDLTLNTEVFYPFRDTAIAGDATVPELIDGVNEALQAMCDEYWSEA